MDKSQFLRGRIVGFVYREARYPDRPSLSLSMTAAQDSFSDGFEVLFEGVSDLRIVDLNGLSSGMTILEARDVRDWQHDGVRYFVTDVEDELFSFKCLSWSCPQQS